MLSQKKAWVVRKTHRYLGLIIGIQFLAWTISGLYFSWTNIDEIHGGSSLLPNDAGLTIRILGNSSEPFIQTILVF